MKHYLKVLYVIMRICIIISVIVKFFIVCKNIIAQISLWLNVTLPSSPVNISKKLKTMPILAHSKTLMINGFFI